MVKGRVAPPKCFFQIEKDRYTLIEQSAHLVLLKIAWHSLTAYILIHNQSSYSFP